MPLGREIARISPPRLSRDAWKRYHTKEFSMSEVVVPVTSTNMTGPAGVTRHPPAAQAGAVHSRGAKSSRHFMTKAFSEFGGMVRPKRAPHDGPKPACPTSLCPTPRFGATPQLIVNQVISAATGGEHRRLDALFGRCTCTLTTGKSTATSLKIFPVLAVSAIGVISAAGANDDSARCSGRGGCGAQVLEAYAR